MAFDATVSQRARKVAIRRSLTISPQPAPVLSARGKPLRQALFEWLAGLLIGAMPIAGHALMHFILQPPPNGESDWSIDVIFVAIATAGTSVASVVMRLVKGMIEVSNIGTDIGCVVVLNVFVLALSAMEYGGVASGHGRDYALFFAIAFFLGSAATSLYVELSLAAKLGA